jgi:hypothetical protein
MPVEIEQYIRKIRVKSVPIPTILLHGCSNSRDNRCSGWFYCKFVDYVDKPTF